MPLEAVYDTLEQILAAYHPLYVKRDGKFHFDAESVEDVSGLKSAMDRLKTPVTVLHPGYWSLFLSINNWL
jgi:hypothetical protein